MRRTPSIALIACLTALAGCGDDTALVAPTVVDLWLGPDVVASEAEIVGVAGVATDPLMGEISSRLAPDHHSMVWIALSDFELGLQDAPGPSFAQLEKKLQALDGDVALAAEPDTELATEAITLYRDWAATTLFGIDRQAFGAYLDQGGK